MSESSYQVKNKFNTLTLAEARKLNRSLSHARQPIRTASVLNKPRPPPLMVTNLAKSQTIVRASNGQLDSCCVLERHKNAPQRLSDDSYVSARSEVSETGPNGCEGNWRLHSGYGTPQRPKSVNLGANGKRSSLSRTSLTSSTYKALQTPLANIKRFFRVGALSRQPSDLSEGSNSNQISKYNHDQDSLSCENEKNDTLTNDDSFKSSLGDFIHSAPLNRSQTPPVCPPPPGELKSMSYMSNNGNNQAYFSGYRNQQDIHRFQRSSSTLPRPPTQPPPPPPPQFLSHRQQPEENSSFITLVGGGDETDAWQLTSLPVYYERNLATVYEDRKQQASAASPNQRDSIGGGGGGGSVAQPSAGNYRHSPMSTYSQLSFASSATAAAAAALSLADPPGKFEHQYERDLAATNSTGPALTSSTNTRSRTGSCQSLVSDTTTELSTFEHHSKQHHHTNSQQRVISTSSRHQQQQQQQQQAATLSLSHYQSPATPYRFSFAQPLAQPAPMSIPNQKNAGLPPRVPSSTFNSAALVDSSNTSGVESGSSSADTIQKHISDNNSSSGNSSNCSSQLNGINHDSRLSSLESSERNSSYSDESTTAGAGAVSSNVAARLMSNGCNGTLNGLENELDATILSETSTLQGDASGAAFYMNRCAELERTVAALKNKLLTKEKELTDLQLSQLNYDYTIDKLKSQVNKLEKENQHLKRRQLYAM